MKPEKKPPVQPEAKKTNVYKEWWAHVKSQKADLYILIGFHVIFAILLRYFYPISDVTPDTEGYILDSYKTYPFVYGTLRPLGYSNFISILHSYSTFPVFITQYILYSTSIILFYFTITYFFRVTIAWQKWLLLAMLTLSIPTLYMTNVIMSDALFTALTIIIVTLLIWILRTGNGLLILSMLGITLFTATVRYLGLIYPALIIPVLYISVRNKLVATVYSILLAGSLFMYIEYIKDNTLRDQGVHVFSAFSGWQKANNALHVIPHIDTTLPIVETDDKELLYIDTLVNLTYKHFSHLYPGDDEVTYELMWNEKSPLKLAQVFSANQSQEEDYHKIWNRISPSFSDYGDLLIQQNFTEYLRYYIWNNTLRTFHPPAETLESYADTNTTKIKIVNAWFGWKEGDKIGPRADVLRPVLKASPFLFSLYWMIYIGSIIAYVVLIIKNRFTYNSLLFKTITLLIAFTGAYTLASIYAAPVNLRFLLPIRAFIIVMPFLLLYAQRVNIEKPE